MPGQRPLSGRVAEMNYGHSGATRRRSLWSWLSAALGIVAIVRAVVGLLAHEAVLGGVMIRRRHTLRRRRLRLAGGLLRGLVLVCEILGRPHAAHRHAL